jgi:hypothetical protein
MALVRHLTNESLSARNDIFANVAIIGAGLVTAYTASARPDLLVGLGIFFVNLDTSSFGGLFAKWSDLTISDQTRFRLQSAVSLFNGPWCREASH